jgi:hypothetical protein
MIRLFKWLFVLAFVAGLAAAGSYAGARFTAGRLLGTEPPVSGRTIQFAYKGVETLPGKPRAWVFTYTQSRLPGVRTVTIYVSPTGKLITTRPRDLAARLDAWAKAQEP